MKEEALQAANATAKEGKTYHYIADVVGLDDYGIPCTGKFSYFSDVVSESNMEVMSSSYYTFTYNYLYSDRFILELESPRDYDGLCFSIYTKGSSKEDINGCAAMIDAFHSQEGQADFINFTFADHSTNQEMNTEEQLDTMNNSFDESVSTEKMMETNDKTNQSEMDDKKTLGISESKEMQKQHSPELIICIVAIIAIVLITIIAVIMIERKRKK